MGMLTLDAAEVDRLTVGGLPTKSLIVFFSAPDIGKTFLATQYAYRCSLPEKQGGLDRPALFISTEPDFFQKRTWERYKSFFEKRWEGGGDVDIFHITNIIEFCKFFGYDIEIDDSSNKTQVHVRAQRIRVPDPKDKRKTKKYIEHPQSSKIYEMLKDRKYGLIVIDSWTQPFKGRINVSNPQNIQARSGIANPLYEMFRTIIKEFDCIIILTNHYTKNPMDRYDRGSPWGGDDVFFNSKHIIGLWNALAKQREKHKTDRIRRIMRVRWATFDPQEVLTIIRKDEGYATLGVDTTGVGSLVT